LTANLTATEAVGATRNGCRLGTSIEHRVAALAGW